MVHIAFIIIKKKLQRQRNTKINRENKYHE